MVRKRARHTLPAKKHNPKVIAALLSYNKTYEKGGQKVRKFFKFRFLVYIKTMDYRWLPPSSRHKPLWEGKMIEKIELENGLILEIWDYSRKIAGDRWLVGFLAQVSVIPSREDFSNEFYYEYFLQNTDGKLYYRYHKERTFVPEKDVPEIYKTIKENFLKAVLPYISRPNFKENLIKTEVALFEKKTDWELMIKQKEKEEEELEKEWADKKYF